MRDKLTDLMSSIGERNAVAVLTFIFTTYNGKGQHQANIVNLFLIASFVMLYTSMLINLQADRTFLIFVLRTEEGFVSEVRASGRCQ